MVARSAATVCLVLVVFVEPFRAYADSTKAPAPMGSPGVATPEAPLEGSSPDATGHIVVQSPDGESCKGIVTFDEKGPPWWYRTSEGLVVKLRCRRTSGQALPEAK